MAGAGVDFLKLRKLTVLFLFFLLGRLRTSLLFHPLSHIMATNSIKLLTGNSHPELAQLVADRYVKDPAKAIFSGKD